MQLKKKLRLICWGTVTFGSLMISCSHGFHLLFLYQHFKCLFISIDTLSSQKQILQTKKKYILKYH